MPSATNFELVVTDDDRTAARRAIVEGWDNCKARPDINFGHRVCDCDLGAVDGCKIKVESVARAIAFARKQ